MGWFSKVGVTGGKIKDLWGGRGFQRNSIIGWAGYVLPAYYGYTGVMKGYAGYNSLTAAKTGAQGTASAQRAGNSGQREGEINKYESAGHDISPQYIKDPVAKPIAMDAGPLNDPNAIAAGQADQMSALARERRQRLVAGMVGRSGYNGGLGMTGNLTQKTLLGA